MKPHASCGRVKCMLPFSHLPFNIYLPIVNAKEYKNKQWFLMEFHSCEAPRQSNLMPKRCNKEDQFKIIAQSFPFHKMSILPHISLGRDHLMIIAIY
jgi:hypothetical protein